MKASHGAFWVLCFGLGLGPEAQKAVVETRKPDSMILFPSEEKDEEMTAASPVRLASDDSCPCQHSSKMRCFYDESCPGLGCGAEGLENCRFCGDKDGQFAACPDADAKAAKPATKPAAKPAEPEAKPAKLELGSDASPCASCLHSKTLPCFYDESCPGVGCGAQGHKNCRFCGGEQFPACPDPNAPKAKPKSSTAVVAPAVTTSGASGDPQMTDEVLEEAQDFDIYRCMAGSAVDTHAMEDDDIADLTGALKYVHTEILTEHLQSPIRQTRKYGIDVVTRHRMKFKNPSTVQKTPNALQGEFSQFVTYDFGKATNPAQLPMIKEQGDFVGIAPCTDLKCDVRFPSPKPYSWLSMGNWCPNLSWDKKGTKSNPNPNCLKHSDGTFIKGGLCENGFNHQSFLPGPEPPTGEQGCVYKYGKATMVKLDDVVGITSEFCGKRRCKDWLDFRFNCSNRQHYQRQFMPNGQIKSVDYCVEFDIHPACEASCQAPACLELLRSGKTAYLGLPFWHGRCDPRSNDRRVETVGFALGLPGALKSHLLVEPKLLQRSCPASKASSWSCVPLAALHFAGPYCTRSFNGACDRCYIPGVAGGPAEVQHPWCPLDVLQSSTYKDLGLKITCKSKSASQHCCLYTGTCDGDSAPGTAPLTDDGLALVAARKNTEDMKNFLTRAASASNRYRALPLDHSNMHWAAYFAWDAAPLDRTLEEALAEMELYLTSERPMVTLYTTTTTTLPMVAGPRPNNFPPSLACAARSVSFGPLDMPGSMATPTANLEECQLKCRKTKGCFHFSMLEVGNSCHLQGFSALAQENTLGFISGPPECWQAKKDKGLLIDKGHDTYVSLSFACMAWGSSFSPALPGAYSTLEEKDFPSEMEATLECQKRCIDRKDCEHFTVSFPIRSCILVGKDAMVTDGIQGAISGPSKCDDKSMQSYYWEALPKSEQPAWRTTSSALSVLGLGMVALAIFMSTLLWRRPACSARSVQSCACDHAESVERSERLMEWYQASSHEQLVESRAWDIELPME